jgi:dipeptidyl aminopeptidase/acylaminoacyl peptidase
MEKKPTRIFFLILGVFIMPYLSASYGLWNSPISADMVAEQGIRFSYVDSHKGEIYWVETRPKEMGRSALVRQRDGQSIVPEPFSVRTTVHEYGGKSFAFYEDTLYFVNFKDQHLYYKNLDETLPTLLIDAPSKRFADFVLHPSGKYLFSVMEDHTDEADVRNSLVKIDLETKEITTIAEGHDFYAAPRLNRDATKLAYIFWDRPNMPWDGTELCLATLDSEGTPLSTKKICGGKEESVLEPLFSKKGTLFYASDKTGYWNLYDETGKALITYKADFSYPLWNLGQKYYDFLEKDGKEYIIAIYTDKATDYLALIDVKNHTFETLNIPYICFEQVSVQDDKVLLLTASYDESTQIVSLDPFTKEVTPLYKPQKQRLSKDLISIPETIEFPTADGKTSFLFYYAPKNPSYPTKTLDGKPPLIVFVHGGPTSHETPSFQMGVQFWTSRGFAVADVNYGGSSGYGREYRNRLRRKWGVVDIEDCKNGALYLVKKGLVDKDRIAIRGGSAGGYTTLAALTFSDTFHVGASYYGVTDLALLAQDTGKFESRYLDNLIGKYPEEIELYHALSPLYHVDKLNHPVLLLQGKEDMVVPQEQADLFYQALLKKGIPTEYLLFEGEQHGFRKADTIKRALEAELAFYNKIFVKN